jgi:uncharacterized protein (TIGR02268 family)
MSCRNLLLFPLCLILLGGASPVAARERAPRESLGAVREPQRRTITVDDASVNTLPEVRVAGGLATVLTFSVPLAERDTNALEGAYKARFHQIVQTTDRTIVLLPVKDLDITIPVTVALRDGTVLVFRCVSVPRQYDGQLDVIIALKNRAPVESVAALKTRIGVLQGDLDQCRATTGDAGASKLASLLLTQDSDQSQAFDRRRLRRIEKDKRLLVEARWAYRLLGLTYLVLSVENRDPDRVWSFDRAEVKVASGKMLTDIAVKAAVVEMPQLPPDAAGHVVVAFPTPASTGPVTVSVTLHEKDGGRSATLGGIEL